MPKTERYEDYLAKEKIDINVNMIAKRLLTIIGSVYIFLLDGPLMLTTQALTDAFTEAGRLDDLNIVVIEMDKGHFEDQRLLVEQEKFPVIFHENMTIETFVSDKHHLQFTFNAVYLDSVVGITNFMYEELMILLEESTALTAYYFLTHALRMHPWFLRNVDYFENGSVVRHRQNMFDEAIYLAHENVKLLSRIAFGMKNYAIEESEFKPYRRTDPETNVKSSAHMLTAAYLIKKADPYDIPILIRPKSRTKKNRIPPAFLIPLRKPVPRVFVDKIEPPAKRRKISQDAMACLVM